MKELCEKCMEEVGGCDNPESCPIFQTVSKLESRVKELESAIACMKQTVNDLAGEKFEAEARVKELEGALQESITERAVYRIDARHPHSAQMLKHAELLESRYVTTLKVANKP